MERAEEEFEDVLEEEEIAIEADEADRPEGLRWREHFIRTHFT